MEQQPNDLLIILVMTFPMILFTIFPGIMISNYLEERFGISETQKRAAMWTFTFLVAAIFSTFIHLY